MLERRQPSLARSGQQFQDVLLQMFLHLLLQQVGNGNRCHPGAKRHIFSITLSKPVIPVGELQTKKERSDTLSRKILRPASDAQRLVRGNRVRSLEAKVNLIKGVTLSENLFILRYIFDVTKILRMTRFCIEV